MKNIVLTLALVCAASPIHAEYESTLKLSKYAELLEKGTYDGADWSHFETPPKSRAYTFQKAFEHFEMNNGKVIVELGTTRSFVHGGLPGCNSNDKAYWEPNNPSAWDFGAGSFTRVAIECLQHTKPVFYTVDLAADHIERSKLITADFADSMIYKVTSSTEFLRNCDFKIDLLYLDTGDMTPIEDTAQLQLEEAKIIVERDLLSENGIILIDDVRNQTPRKFGDDSGLGKSKYAIPYFLQNGYELVADEYQVMLRKNTQSRFSQAE